MPKANLYYQDRVPSPLTLIWQNFSRNRLAMAALYCLGLLLITMLASHALAPYDANQQFAESLSVAPSWTDAGDMRYLFGTDDLGRDMLSRIIIGSIYSFGYPLLIVLVAGFIGISLGALAGMSRGLKSSSLNHLLDVLLSIPSLLLALVVIAILGPSLENAVIAIVLVLIPQFLHATRNAVRDELKRDYVIASRLNGVPPRYLLWRVILPNITPVLVMHITLGISTAILDIALLGFLGLGAQAPAPEWGTMLARSLDQVYVSPWTMALPGLALFLTILSINVVGDSLRAAIKARAEES
ncbi:ABC transporter permease subunit [Idiomarina xiamenensis]|uniref:Peptide ABC transporter permease n=1 Tax=Idiomarina xiamenensis 10-D-4 TaxID=740709 RepID=K2KQP6_9GAMM|nr:ABC transporter permease subunit [Idiomarina xiamenensis]EKE84769.1 peptide ABC transporter permease [Idiomarina xiamenensis 10-D-4]